jgi:hypothetical protein
VRRLRLARGNRVPASRTLAVDSSTELQSASTTIVDDGSMRGETSGTVWGSTSTLGDLGTATEAEGPYNEAEQGHRRHPEDDDRDSVALPPLSRSSDVWRSERFQLWREDYIHWVPGLSFEDKAELLACSKECQDLSDFIKMLRVWEEKQEMVRLEKQERNSRPLVHPVAQLRRFMNSS